MSWLDFQPKAYRLLPTTSGLPQPSPTPVDQVGLGLSHRDPFQPDDSGLMSFLDRPRQCSGSAAGAKEASSVSGTRIAVVSGGMWSVGMKCGMLSTGSIRR